jgi:predicted NAD-dependent protein-ADP-ribosyltransferase YbiA (DUF1768 family)
MSQAIKEFSFLNRWFIFKRKRQESVAAATMAEASVSPVGSLSGNKGKAPGAAAAAPPAAPAAAANQNKGRSAALKAAAEANSAAATALQQEGLKPANKNRVAEVAKAASTMTPAKTVPVAPGPAANPLAGRSYTEGEVFLFYSKAGVKKDVLGIKDPGAGRWLAPSARFPIEDKEEGSEEAVIYPTVDHYIAGMRVKLATDPPKPELAKAIFSREGTIHQKFLTDRLSLTNAGTKPLSEEEDARLLETEVAAVKDAMRPPFLKRYKATVDEAKWATVKDSVLEEAITQRWTKDARFRKIITAARDRGKYLLYYTPGSSTSNMGGVRSLQSGRIEGENRIGKIMMKLAGYPD